MKITKKINIVSGIGISLVWMVTGIFCFTTTGIVTFALSLATAATIVVAIATYTTIQSLKERGDTEEWLSGRHGKE